jgi:hypothetical protein
VTMANGTVAGDSFNRNTLRSPLGNQVERLIDYRAVLFVALSTRANPNSLQSVHDSLAFGRSAFRSLHKAKYP